MYGKRGARGGDSAQLRLGGVADGIVPEPQAGHRGVDLERLRDCDCARVANVVVEQPAKSEQVRGWSGEFRQKASRWSGDGRAGFIEERAHLNSVTEALTSSALANMTTSRSSRKDSRLIFDALIISVRDIRSKLQTLFITFRFSKISFFQ